LGTPLAQTVSEENTAMKRTVFVWLLAFALLTPYSVAQSTASAPAPQTPFEKIVSEYYRIHDALARDTTEGVNEAAQKIVKLASDASNKKPVNSPDFVAIKRAASALQGKSLAEARQQFFELSKPIIAELKRNPSSRTSAFTYKCSMANKSWVQNKKDIRNPYYGKSMLKCGEPL